MNDQVLLIISFLLIGFSGYKISQIGAIISKNDEGGGSKEIYPRCNNCKYFMKGSEPAFDGPWCSRFSTSFQDNTSRLDGIYATSENNEATFYITKDFHCSLWAEKIND